MPLQVPFRSRVLLVLARTELCIAAEQQERAEEMLASEVAFADDLLSLARQNGSMEQIQAVTAGCYQLRDRATQISLLQRSAPDIEVSDWVVGQLKTLSELRGRVVLLEFWARSCPPCLAMFPALGELGRRYSDQGLTILALTCYGPAVSDPAGRVRERELITQASAHCDPTIAVGIAPDARNQKRYGANGLPTYAIIDRAGIVQVSSSIPDKAKMEQAIANLL